MTIVVPTIYRGPFLDLELPKATEGAIVTVRNASTGKSMSVVLPAAFAATTLTFDWTAKRITDSGGADRSALLSVTDNDLWTEPGPFAPGAEIEVQVEVSGLTPGQDEFAQAVGALNGKEAEKGGKWSTSGAATDFANTGVKSVRRETVGDASERLALIALPNLVNLDAELDVTWSVGKASDSSYIPLFGPNLFVGIVSEAGGNVSLQIAQSGGGSTSTPVALALGQKYRIIARRRGAKVTATLISLASLTVVAEASLGGLSTTPANSGGISDKHTGATASTRTYERLRIFGGAFKAKATLRWEVGYY